MKTAFFVAAAAAVSATTLSDMVAEQDFAAFVKQYNKQYTKEELVERLAIFKKNMNTIKNHDGKAEGYTLEINEFADLTWEEFSQMYKGYNHRERNYAASQNLHKNSGLMLKTHVDWREQGVVTPVKNQGQCGSCWSFSTSTATESAHAIATGKLVSLSPQQMVDCAGNYGNMGCNGGNIDFAFEYVHDHGLVSEQDYPYQGQQMSCRASNYETVTKITGYRDVQRGSERDLMDAVANNGPVSIAIQADQPQFQFYSGGVLKANCGRQLDHAVLLVGYGTENGDDYWLVRNSWGESWGEGGYVKLVRGVDECGVSDNAAYPYIN